MMRMRHLELIPLARRHSSLLKPAHIVLVLLGSLTRPRSTFLCIKPSWTALISCNCKTRRVCRTTSICHTWCTMAISNSSGLTPYPIGGPMDLPVPASFLYIFLPSPCVPLSMLFIGDNVRLKHGGCATWDTVSDWP